MRPLVWILATASALPAQTTAFPRLFAAPAGESLTTAWSLATGDVTGDGRADVLVSTARGVFLVSGGTPIQTQVSRLAVAAERTPSGAVVRGNVCDLALADLDANGTLDLVEACGNTRALVVLLGSGAGTFREVARYALKRAGNGPRPTAGLAVADLNGDNRPDVAVAQDDSVAVLAGNGDGTMQTAVESPAGQWPSAVIAVDFNADGRLDLAASNWLSETITVLTGDGRGAFRASTVSVGDRPFGIAAADLNGDGRLDLAVAAENVVFLLGAGDGTFSRGPRFPHDARAVSVAARDLNNDSRADVVVGNYYGGGVSIFLSQADGNFRESLAAPSVGDVFGVAFADTTGDRQPDLILSSYSGSALGVAAGVGAGVFETPVFFGVVGGSLLSGALTSGGASDLIAVAPARKTIFVSAGGTTAPVALATADYPQAARMGDFNGDGLPDLLLLTMRRWPPGEPGLALELWPGRGDRTFLAPVRTPVNAAFAETLLAVGDFNGDGRPDAATLDRMAARLDIWTAQRDGTFTLASTAAAGSLLTTAFIAVDLNRDGLADLALLTGGGETRVQVLVTRGAGATLAVCPEGTRLAAGDFNGDGAPELAVDCGARGVQWIDNGAVRSSALPLTFGPGALIDTADFNGDGRLDLAIMAANAERFAPAGIVSGGGSLAAAISGVETPLAIATGRWTGQTRPGFAYWNAETAAVVVHGNQLEAGFPRPLVTVSAASLAAGPVAPDSIVSAFGEALAGAVVEAESPRALPRSLGGTSVELTDAGGLSTPLQLYFVAPGQINALMPLVVNPGVGVLRAVRDGRIVAEGYVTMAPSAPAIFTANADGRGAPAALLQRFKSDGSSATEPVFDCASGRCVPRVLNLDPSNGEAWLLLFGTGIRRCPVNATVTVGALALPVASAGPQSEFPGLDQINVRLPASLVGAGEADLIFRNVCGGVANAVRVTIR